MRQWRKLLFFGGLVFAAWVGLLALYRQETAGPGRLVTSFSMQVFDLAFSPDGQRLAVSGEDADGSEHVQIYDVPTGVLRQTIPITNRVTALVFSTDSKSLSGMEQGQVIALNAPLPNAGAPGSTAILPVPSQGNFAGDTFNPLQGPRVVSLVGRLTAVAMSADVQKINGQYQLVAGAYVAVNGQAGKRLLTFPEDDYGGAQVLAFSPDEHLLAIQDGQGRCVIRDLQKNGQVVRMMSGLKSERKPHSGPLCTPQADSLTFSTDGALLAAGRRDGKVMLYDMKTGLRLRTLGEQEDSIQIVKFSPDGAYLATCDMAGTVMLWKVSGI